MTTFSPRALAPLLAAAPGRCLGAVAGLWRDWLDATRWPGRLLGVAVLLALATLPAWGGPPLIAALIAVLWLACAAQGWNLLAGFAGLFSLGHALFIGLAAYLTAALALHGTAGAWAGALLALPAAALAGAAVGALGCRAGLSGTHFTLATLILAEAARLGALRLEGLGAGAGLTLPALPSGGKPLLFYYAILILAGLTLAAVRLLLRSRLGYHWLALREDPQAAAAIGIEPCRARVTAVAVSAALAAPAGVFLALYARHVDPEHTLSLAASLAPVLAATLGGIGTLVGPVLGAFLVVPADLGLSWLIAHSPRDLTLLKPLATGLALMLAAAAFPDGLWPGLARLLGLLRPPPADDGGAG